MEQQIMHYSQVINLIDTFQHFIREYYPISKNDVGGSGFYSFSDTDHYTEINHIVVTLDTLLEIARIHFNGNFDSLIITTDSKPINYRKKDKTSILVGFRTNILQDDDYYSLEPEKFWFQTTLDKLPENVGFCEKSV
tara:strand:- start:74 stop:484 length:411 start_codon:yes stop_codon:yes gene_type:complete